ARLASAAIRSRLQSSRTWIFGSLNIFRSARRPSWMSLPRLSTFSTGRTLRRSIRFSVQGPLPCPASCIRLPASARGVFSSRLISSSNSLAFFGSKLLFLRIKQKGRRDGPGHSIRVEALVERKSLHGHRLGDAGAMHRGEHGHLHGAESDCARSPALSRFVAL